MSFIPGSNLLNMALSVIASQEVDYYKATTESVNSIGLKVPQYDPPVLIWGSFQPVQKALYAEYGLDFNRSYVNFYTSNDLIDIERNVSGDKIVYQGNTYNCESSTEWIGIDGWIAILTVLQVLAPPQ